MTSSFLLRCHHVLLAMPYKVFLRLQTLQTIWYWVFNMGEGFPSSWDLWCSNYSILIENRCFCNGKSLLEVDPSSVFRPTPIEHSHVTSQSRENHTGGHFGVQLNGDLVCCTMHLQNAVQTWQLMDLPHKYVRYRYPVHVICETWAHWLRISRLSHTSSYPLVHQDGRHEQKYHGVMQTYISFYHVMKTLYTSHTRHVHDCIKYLSAFRFYRNVLTSEQLNSKICGHGFVLKVVEQPVLGNVPKCVWNRMCVQIWAAGNISGHSIVLTFPTGLDSRNERGGSGGHLN